MQMKLSRELLTNGCDILFVTAGRLSHYYDLLPEKSVSVSLGRFLQCYCFLALPRRKPRPGEPDLDGLGRGREVFAAGRLAHVRNARILQ